MHPRVTAAADLAGGVALRRGVVHHVRLPAPVRLRDEAREALLEVLRVVVDRHGNRDAWAAGRHRAMFSGRRRRVYRGASRAQTLASSWAVWGQSSAWPPKSSTPALNTRAPLECS